MIIDTHSHIYSKEFDEDREETLKRAIEKGVAKILLPNIDEESFPNMMNVYNFRPDLFDVMIGVHPTSVKNKVEFYKKWLKENYSDDFIAIGEIGIDLYWDKSFLSEQQELLEYQIDFAIEHSKPVVLHIRDSFNEVFEVLEKYKGRNLKGVFHCFSGNLEEAYRALSYGFYLGIGGVVTFKKSKLPDVIKTVGMENIVIETDSPYLSPSPKRGKRNESSNLVYIISKLSEITENEAEEIENKTAQNAKDLFKLNVDF